MKFKNKKLFWKYFKKSGIIIVKNCHRIFREYLLESLTGTFFGGIESVNYFFSWSTIIFLMETGVHFFITIFLHLLNSAKLLSFSENMDMNLSRILKSFSKTMFLIIKVSFCLSALGSSLPAKLLFQSIGVTKYPYFLFEGGR